MRFYRSVSGSHQVAKGNGPLLELFISPGHSVLGSKWSHPWQTGSTGSAVRKSLHKSLSRYLISHRMVLSTLLDFIMLYCLCLGSHVCPASLRVSYVLPNCLCVPLNYLIPASTEQNLSSTCWVLRTYNSTLYLCWRASRLKIKRWLFWSFDGQTGVRPSYFYLLTLKPRKFHRALPLPRLQQVLWCLAISEN